MDPTLPGRARVLRGLLEKHAQEHPDVARCQRELEPILDAASSAPAFEPPRDVPCARFVTEGGLAAWPDLDRAYSAFYVALLDIGDVPIPD